MSFRLNLVMQFASALAPGFLRGSSTVIPSVSTRRVGGRSLGHAT